MSRLHHPNILSFFGAGTSPPNLFLVTEWMSRGDLFSIIGDSLSPFHQFSTASRYIFRKILLFIFSTHFHI
jgi:serine/threonine protein kinase